MADCGLGQEQEEKDEDDVEDFDKPLPSSDDFPANFKEYMERELKYSRLEICAKPPGYKPGRAMIYWKEIRWIFWNRQDDPTLSYDHSVDFFPDVRLNIRKALHKLMLYPELSYSVVQFWAPSKTKEGRTLLSTQFQPFAIGTTEYPTADLHHLCEYRVGMCREYNSFYADAESGEEQLGLPGRVFLNKFPISTLQGVHYTLKEYPQRDLALRCRIRASWALPVFEHSGHTCVGVLEIARTQSSFSWFNEEFLGRMYDIFEEFNLRCFDGYKHCKMKYGDESGGKNKAHTAAFQELEMVYESVHKIHNLRMILTWVSCRSCNDLLHCQFQLVSRDYGGKFNCFSKNLLDFMRVCEHSLLKKGQVTGRILPFPNLLYCSDVKQFSIAESPLVPHARYCKLGGWFTMCLQSSHTGDKLYVLEFFLSESNKNDENVLTRLSLILGTMEKYFRTFKLASGQGLGEALSVEVIDFQYGQRSHSIQMIPATRFIPSLELLHDEEVMSSNGLVVSSSKGKRKMQDREHKKAGGRIYVSLEEILKCSNMKRKYAAEKFEVSESTFKRLCRDYGIHRWPPQSQGQIPQLNSDLPYDEALAGVSHIKPGFQDANMMTIRVKYENHNLKFRLPLSSRFVQLQQEVEKRLNLEAGTYYVKYKDEEDELTLIACEEDLKDFMHTSRSLGKTSVEVLLELKQPITNLNPGLSGGQQTLFSPLRSQDLQSAEGEPSIVPIMHNRGGVWLDGHFSYTPTIDEEETINKCMQDGSFGGEFVDGCWISNITVMKYSEMLDHYLSHCHFFNPNVVKNFKKSGRLLNTILLPKTEKIFFPILRDRHWMLLVIDVKKKYFLWLDSMRCEREKKYSENFAHFLNYEFVFKRLTEQNEWPIKYPENTPIQENGNDCGVYMMAFMISLAVGDKLPQFSQAQAKRMRRTICLELKRWDIIPQCPLIDYHFLYIQERKKNELNVKLRKESTAASRDEAFLVSETSRKVRGSSS